MKMFVCATTKRLAACFFLLACLAGVSLESRADILPAERRIQWTPGIPGGIPTRTQIFCNVKVSIPGTNIIARADGITDDSGAINAAIARCPSNQVVYLPAGTYRITNTIQMKNNGVTIRGDGQGKTVLQLYGGWLSMNSGPGVSWDFNITNCTRGSTNIYFTYTNSLPPMYPAVGLYLLIDETNDNVEVTSSGSVGGTASWNSRMAGTRARGQIVQILSATGKTNFTFQPPLYWNYTNAPRAAALMPIVTLCGIESLSVSNVVSNNAVGYSIWMQGCSRCWVKDVESGFCNSAHIYMMYCHECEIRDNYLHHGITTYDGGKAYGIWLSNQSTACLLENNILYFLHDALEIGQGTIGSVIAYNYCEHVMYYRTNILLEDCSFHGAHCSFNLVEGNILHRVGSDFYYGSHSDNTFFRNRVYGTQLGCDTALTCFTIEMLSHRLNIVGNVLGDVNFKGPYQRYNVTRVYSLESEIYRIGYTDEATQPSAGVDTNSLTTLLRHGNYDFVTKSVIWDPTITDTNLPSSYYLTAKPAWWGTMPWPPIGPDLAVMTGTIPAQVRWNQIQAGDDLSAPTGLHVLPK